MKSEHFGRVTEPTVSQPGTVAALLRELGVRDASGHQVADTLRTWMHKNVPNQQLRISILRNGLGVVLDRRVWR